MIGLGIWEEIANIHTNRQIANYSKFLVLEKVSKETVQGNMRTIPLQGEATALGCKNQDERERHMTPPLANALVRKNRELQSENLKLKKLIDKWSSSSVQAANSDTVVKRLQETVNLHRRQIVELEEQRDLLEASSCSPDTATPTLY